jgi:hypothetical protein
MVAVPASRLLPSYNRWACVKRIISGQKTRPHIVENHRDSHAVNRYLVNSEAKSYRNGLVSAALAKNAWLYRNVFLAIYGGFFSGGYVTLLTATFVVFFGLTFIQSIATTKVLSPFSSAVATMVLAWHRIADYRLGAVLGITTFFGVLAGGHITQAQPGFGFAALLSS